MVFLTRLHDLVVRTLLWPARAVEGNGAFDTERRSPNLPTSSLGTFSCSVVGRLYTHVPQDLTVLQQKFTFDISKISRQVCFLHLRKTRNTPVMNACSYKLGHSDLQCGDSPASKQIVLTPETSQQTPNGTSGGDHASSHALQQRIEQLESDMIKVTRLNAAWVYASHSQRSKTEHSKLLLCIEVQIIKLAYMY